MEKYRTLSRITTVTKRYTSADLSPGHGRGFFEGRGQGMQKLEEILRAEEKARHLVVSAREKADALVRDAEATAKKIVDDARAEASDQARSLRERLLSEAEAQARAITQDSAASTEDVLDAARQRMKVAVAAALERLKG